MSATPPPWGRWIVPVSAPPRERGAILGDLEEGFRRRARDDGPASARFWYAGQVLRSLLPLLQASFEELSVRRVFAGVLAGLVLTSVAPAVVDRLVGPGSAAGLGLFAWYGILATATSVAGGYAGVRIARIRAAAPMAFLVSFLYAPLGYRIAADPGSMLPEVGWLAWMLCGAIGGGVLAGRRTLRTV